MDNDMPDKRTVKPEQHGTLTGYSYGCRCKECRAASATYARRRRRANPETGLTNARHRQQRRESYYRNRGETLGRRKERRATPKGRTRRAVQERTYRAKHKTKIARYQADWYLRNKEWHHVNAARWRARNGDKIRRRQAARWLAKKDEIMAYRRANADRMATHFVNRDARRRGAVGSHSAAEWRALCESYDNRCAYCGAQTKLTRDHIVPLCPCRTEPDEQHRQHSARLQVVQLCEAQDDLR